jgi:hypothetical protein
MFGHDNQDDQTQDTNDQANMHMVTDPVANDILGSDDNNPAPAVPAGDVVGAPMPPAPSLPSEPAVDELPTPDSHDDAGSDSDTLVTPPSEDLVSIKQEALQQLSPLVGHLDQTPEEKFRTTMMMIQASDDQSLVKAAYDAAKQITDDKERAQALLDIVNEINYFTQHQNS